MTKVSAILGFMVIISTNLAFAANQTQLSAKACANDAIEQTEKLLRFHNGYSSDATIANHVIPSLSDVKALPPELIVGTGHHLEVLQVSTGIYKGDYKVIVKYAVLNDINNPAGIACILMSQAITDESNPF